jgi:TonB family protein
MKLRKYSCIAGLLVLCISCASSPKVDDGVTGPGQPNNELAEKIRLVTSEFRTTGRHFSEKFKERIALWDERKKLIDYSSQLPVIERAANANLAIRINTLTARIQKLDDEMKSHYVIASKAGKYQAFVDSCISKISMEGTKRYPHVARGKDYGSASATFTVLPNGDIRNLKISKKTGHKILDDALVEAFANATPCPSFSETMAEELDFLTVAVTMAFAND